MIKSSTEVADKKKKKKTCFHQEICFGDLNISSHILKKSDLGYVSLAMRNSVFVWNTVWSHSSSLRQTQP